MRHQELMTAHNHTEHTLLYSTTRMFIWITSINIHAIARSRYSYDSIGCNYNNNNYLLLQFLLRCICLFHLSPLPPPGSFYNLLCRYDYHDDTCIWALNNLSFAKLFIVELKKDDTQFATKGQCNYSTY